MIATPAATSLDLTEAAAFLGIHKDTLRERAASGMIPGVKLGKEWRFLDVDLAAYVRSQYKEPTECQSSGDHARPSGTATFATAADALDDLLAQATATKRSASTTSLRLLPGKSEPTANASLMPSSPGTRRSRASRQRSGR